MIKRIGLLVLVCLSFISGSLFSSSAQRGQVLTGQGIPGHLAKWTGPYTLGSANTAIDLNAHVQQLQFEIAPNQTRDIPLPQVNRPIRIEVGIGNNLLNGIPTNPLLLSGLILLDAQSQIGRVIQGTPNLIEPLGCFQPNPVIAPDQAVDADTTGGQIGLDGRRCVLSAALILRADKTLVLSVVAASFAQHGPLSVTVTLWF